MSRSCGHFKTIPSVLSGLCENWRPIEVWSPEIFGPNVLEFFLEIKFYIEIHISKIEFHTFEKYDPPYPPPTKSAAAL